MSFRMEKWFPLQASGSEFPKCFLIQAWSEKKLRESTNSSKIASRKAILTFDELSTKILCSPGGLQFYWPWTTITGRSWQTCTRQRKISSNCASRTKVFSVDGRKHIERFVFISRYVDHKGWIWWSRSKHRSPKMLPIKIQYKQQSILYNSSNFFIISVLGTSWGYWPIKFSFERFLFNKSPLRFLILEETFVAKAATAEERWQFKG